MAGSTSVNKRTQLCTLAATLQCDVSKLLSTSFANLYVGQTTFVNTCSCVHSLPNLYASFAKVILRVVVPLTKLSLFSNSPQHTSFWYSNSTQHQWAQALHHQSWRHLWIILFIFSQNPNTQQLLVISLVMSGALSVQRDHLHNSVTVNVETIEVKWIFQILFTKNNHVSIQGSS